MVALKTEIKEKMEMISNGQAPEGYQKKRIGIVPKDWELKRLGKVFDTVDYRGATPEKVESGIRLITAKNIKDGFIDYEASKEYVRESEYDKIMRRGKPKVGDILFTTEAPLGSVAIVDCAKVALAQRIIKLRGKKNLLIINLLNIFNGKYVSERITREATGTTVKGIKSSRLKRLLLYYHHYPNNRKSSKSSQPGIKL